jgi:hypothetical protein
MNMEFTHSPVPAHCWEIPTIIIECRHERYKLKRLIVQKLPEWISIMLGTISAIQDEKNYSPVIVEDIAEWSGIDPAIVAVACDELARDQILIVRDLNVQIHPDLIIYDDITFRLVEETINLVIAGDPGWPISESKDLNPLINIQPLENISGLDERSDMVLPSQWLKWINYDNIIGGELTSISRQGYYLAKAIPNGDGSIQIFIENSNNTKNRKHFSCTVAEDHPLSNYLLDRVKHARDKVNDFVSEIGLKIQKQDDQKLLFYVDLICLEQLRYLSHGFDEFGVTATQQTHGDQITIAIQIVPADIDTANRLLIERTVHQILDQEELSWDSVDKLLHEQQHVVKWSIKPKPNFSKSEFIDHAWETGAWIICYRLVSEEDGLA